MSGGIKIAMTHAKEAQELIWQGELKECFFGVEFFA